MTFSAFSSAAQLCNKQEWLRLPTDPRRTQNPNVYDDCIVCRCRWHWTTSVKLPLDLLPQMFYIGFRAVSHADSSSQPELHCHTILTYSVFVWSYLLGRQRRQWIVFCFVFVLKSFFYKRGFPRQFAYCVSVLKEISVRWNLFVLGSCHWRSASPRPCILLNLSQKHNCLFVFFPRNYASRCVYLLNQR